MELVKEQAAAGAIRLEPLAINDQLRDGALANVANELIGRRRIVVDIDFGVGEVMGVEEMLGGTAVAAPGCGVNGNLHTLILA